MFSIRSERQWVQQIEFNFLYRWFVGPTLDAEVWDQPTFSANRERSGRIRLTTCRRSCKRSGNKGVTPHVARKEKGSAIDGRTTRHPGYRTRLKMRKRVEEIFGWSKTVGGLRQTRFRGLKKVAAQTVFTFAAYQLTRLGGLFGWRWLSVKAGVCPKFAERRQEPPSGGMKTASNRDFRADWTFSTEN